MPKISATSGPSIAGLTTAPPAEDDYTEAMKRHGTDAFTAEDADVVRAYLADRQARDARSLDLHAEPPEVAAAASEDAAAKAAGGPDEKGMSDRILEGAITSEQRVQARAEHDEVNDDPSTGTTVEPIGGSDDDSSDNDDDSAAASPRDAEGSDAADRESPVRAGTDGNETGGSGSRSAAKTTASGSTARKSNR